MLEVKHVKTNYGRRTFDYVGPRLWNALPLDIRTEEKVDIFKKKVKTILFNGTEELKARAWKYTQVKYVDSACEQWCESTENLCAISNVHIIIIIIIIKLQNFSSF